MLIAKLKNLGVIYATLTLHLLGCRSLSPLTSAPPTPLDQSSAILGVSTENRTMKTFGHRGASASWPENTLRSVKEALESADGAEIDIQLTKDNALIVLHDDTLRRTASLWPQKKSNLECLIDTPVSALTWSQIKETIVGVNGEVIPHLGSVIDLLKQYPNKKLLVEIKSYSTGSTKDTKNKVALDSMLKALNKFFSTLTPQLRSQLILISFDEHVLQGAKQNNHLKDIDSYLLFTGEDIIDFHRRGQLDALLDKSANLTGLDIESGPYLYRPLVGQKNIVDLIKSRKKRVITWVSRGKRTDGIYWHQVSKSLGVDIFTSDLPLSLLAPKRNNARIKQTLDMLRKRGLNTPIPAQIAGGPSSNEYLIFNGFSLKGKTYRMYLPMAGDFPGLPSSQWNEAIRRDLEYLLEPLFLSPNDSRENRGVVINLADLTNLERQSFISHLKDLPKIMGSKLIVIEPP